MDWWKGKAFIGGQQPGKVAMGVRDREVWCGQASRASCGVCCETCLTIQSGSPLKGFLLSLLRPHHLLCGMWKNQEGQLAREVDPGLALVTSQNYV